MKSELCHSLLSLFYSSTFAFTLMAAHDEISPQPLKLSNILFSKLAVQQWNIACGHSCLLSINKSALSLIRCLNDNISCQCFSKVFLYLKTFMAIIWLVQTQKYFIRVREKTRFRLKYLVKSRPKEAILNSQITGRKLWPPVSNILLTRLTCKDLMLYYHKEVVCKCSLMFQTAAYQQLKRGKMQ